VDWWRICGWLLGLGLVGLDLRGELEGSEVDVVVGGGAFARETCVGGTGAIMRFYRGCKFTATTKWSVGVRRCVARAGWTRTFGRG
jgi:hypothetical protein